MGRKAMFPRLIQDTLEAGLLTPEQAWQLEWEMAGPEPTWSTQAAPLARLVRLHSLDPCQMPAQ